jgi:hypothetical protein
VEGVGTGPLSLNKIEVLRVDDLDAIRRVSSSLFRIEGPDAHHYTHVLEVFEGT